MMHREEQIPLVIPPAVTVVDRCSPSRVLLNCCLFFACAEVALLVRLERALSPVRQMRRNAMVTAKYQ